MSEVERYYDASAAQEWARLQRFPMESAVTRHALTEYLPTPPARILDVGGGPAGMPSPWLSRAMPSPSSTRHRAVSMSPGRKPQRQASN